MKLKTLIKSLRDFRVFHRWMGLTLALLLMISAVTGVLLALKKEVEIIQPPTQKGVSENLAEWKSLDEISEIAEKVLHETYPEQKENSVDRMDARPSKGIVKVLFEAGNWEVQVDGKSGEVKSVEKRYSDWIESLHDGSIISDGFKLFSMNFLGIGLLLLIGTGVWLWYGPRRIRLKKKKG